MNNLGELISERRLTPRLFPLQNARIVNQHASQCPTGIRSQIREARWLPIRRSWGVRRNRAEEVLAEIGYAEGEIQEMAEAGLVGLAQDAKKA